MKTRYISFLFVLVCLFLSGPACAELYGQTRGLNFTSISVTPAESSGSGLTLLVGYTTVARLDRVNVSCYYQPGDGSAAVEMGSNQQAEYSDNPIEKMMTFTFSVGRPGDYQAYCTSSDGARSGSTAFRVKEGITATPAPSPTPLFTPTPEPTITPVPPTITPVLPTATPGDVITIIIPCAWQVGGTWSITQVNGYHPVFEITQEGAALSGTATLSASEATLGGYTGNVGAGAGSVEGDTFTFAVTWPPKTDGQVVTGTYTGKISDGRIDGDTWYGTGPTQCILH